MVLCAVLLFAILLQTVAPHLRLAMQFADAPRRLPVPLAILFPVAPRCGRARDSPRFVAGWASRSHQDRGS